MTDVNPDWLTDANGNRCSIRWFGSREAAQAALDSLRGCENCTNCSGCSDCSDCSRCSDCSGCSRCSRCSDCSGCSRCSGCSHVANLYDRRDLKGDPSSDWSGPPAIPTIENIHARQPLAGRRHAVGGVR